MKQGAEARLDRDYSNDKYQNLSENASFYDSFAKRLNQSQNRTTQHARRGIAVTGEAWEFGSDGARREHTVDYGTAGYKGSGNLPAGRRSLGRRAEPMGSTPAYSHRGGTYGGMGSSFQFA